MMPSARLITLREFLYLLLDHIGILIQNEKSRAIALQKIPDQDYS